MKKYIAEFIGTMVLVLFGCGTAVATGGLTGGGAAGTTLGVLTIAMAFGLSIVAMAFAIGPASGCHINPAVSFGMLVAGKMRAVQFAGYVIAQILGALAGSAVIKFIVVNSTSLAENGMGQNGFGGESAVGLSMAGAIVVEVILTFVFVLTILGVTSGEKTAPFAGIVIGLTLAFVHILGIPLTGTSVNPARSIAPAIFHGGTALTQLWVFIVAPLIGALVAALVYKAVVAARGESGLAK